MKSYSFDFSFFGFCQRCWSFRLLGDYHIDHVVVATDGNPVLGLFRPSALFGWINRITGCIPLDVFEDLFEVEKNKSVDTVYPQDSLGDPGAYLALGDFKLSRDVRDSYQVLCWFAFLTNSSHREFFPGDLRLCAAVYTSTVEVNFLSIRRNLNSHTVPIPPCSARIVFVEGFCIYRVIRCNKKTLFILLCVIWQQYDYYYSNKM